MAFRYDRLKALRKEKGYKQVTLARDLHVSRSTLAMWEIGQSEPTTEMCSRIAELLDCSVGYLLGTEDEVNAVKAFDALRAEFREYSEEKVDRLRNIGQQLTAPSRSSEWRTLSEGLAKMEKENKPAFQALYTFLTSSYPGNFTERTDDDDTES